MSPPPLSTLLMVMLWLGIAVVGVSGTYLLISETDPIMSLRPTANWVLSLLFLATALSAVGTALSALIGWLFGPALSNDALDACWWAGAGFTGLIAIFGASFALCSVFLLT